MPQERGGPEPGDGPPPPRTRDQAPAFTAEVSVTYPPDDDDVEACSSALGAGGVTLVAQVPPGGGPEVSLPLRFVPVSGVPTSGGPFLGRVIDVRMADDAAIIAVAFDGPLGPGHMPGLFREAASGRPPPVGGADASPRAGTAPPARPRRGPSAGRPGPPGLAVHLIEDPPRWNPSAS
ncbi:hypothetical protein OJF2_04940 [Aquisphaera giovannonii]|uniref:Uncharacterized protein n=1 Tax=Aquisphaera giovannonii TaxID=406548 RepID=A0A5B9VW64_9BACT|nr:hypothetical protein [Aquisphaera giovannonii]QEH32025.1 hypothetical protein OJF2_04940 [Aquisphaera giovannonii]